MGKERISVSLVRRMAGSSQPLGVGLIGQQSFVLLSFEMESICAGMHSLFSGMCFELGGSCWRQGPKRACRKALLEASFLKPCHVCFVIAGLQ